MLNSLPEYDYLQVSLAEGVIDHLPVLIIIRKQNIINVYRTAGFQSRSRPEPGYLAGAGAVTLARLRLHLKYLFNNSCKLYGT